MPAEVWLIPPIVILALMIAIGCLRRSLLLRRYRAITARSELTVAPKVLNPSEVRGFVLRLAPGAICTVTGGEFRALGRITAIR